MELSRILCDKRTLCQYRHIGLGEAIDALGSELPALPAEPAVKTAVPKPRHRSVVSIGSLLNPAPTRRLMATPKIRKKPRGRKTKKSLLNEMIKSSEMQKWTEKMSSLDTDAQGCFT